MRLLLTTLGMAACGGIDEDAPIAWALNDAEITVAEDGISGQQTWHFYKEGWENDQETEALACRVRQELEGSAIQVQGCTAAYTIEVLLLDSDCPDEINALSLLDQSLRAFCIGPITEHAKADSPWPDLSMGWAIQRQEGENFLEHGYAYAAGLEEETPVEPGWISGQDYVLWPTWAWSL
jgi:hypothetical protein